MQTSRPHGFYIVDDSEPIRLRLAQFLAAVEGVCVVGEAASAAEAIDGILRIRPQAVLLDLHLVGRTGLDVLRAVCSRHPEIVFVVLTNSVDAQYRKACMDAGATYFLDKSRDLDRVHSVIAEIAAAIH